MIQSVTRERWEEAQIAEAQTAVYDLEDCKRAYNYIFDYLGISKDQGGKKIVEVGCGTYPAVMFCENAPAIVFEPIQSQPDHCPDTILWIKAQFEEFDKFTAHEVWLFNVLQHVRDPEQIIANAKKVGSVVRFFEPVDYPTCVYHPHTFTQADFERWFPGSVKRYTDRLPGFFDADCCYGSFEC